MINTNTPPNPGSDAAIAQGCICPVLDNNHGKGIIWGDKQVFWTNENCPLHAPKQAKD